MDPCDEVSDTLCINTNGSFYCGCQPGYSRNGVFCTGSYRDSIIHAWIGCKLLKIFNLRYQ